MMMRRSGRPRLQQDESPEVLLLAREDELPSLTPARATLQQVMAAYVEGWGDFRRLYCVYYDCCLNAVVAQTRWESFTCQRCPVHEDISPEVRLRQDTALGHAVVRGGERT